MKQLGISIYPQHSTVKRDQEYISLAHQYGFTRIFTCLLSVASDQEEVLNQFAQITNHANELGMQVIVDVAPRVFDGLKISYDDLSFFYQLGFSGIRMDQGFSGIEEAILTHNPHDLQIELNMSQGTKYIDHIMSFNPNLQNLIGAHNFYPHRYTGLSYGHFLQCSQQFREYGIRTAAFVNSRAASFGPWPITEGLCTLEMHRYLPIQVQAKHLFATGLIDDVIIANAYASESELKAVSNVDKHRITFRITLENTTTDVERKIILEELHVNRGDVSDYLARSSQPRIKYKHESIPATYTPSIRRGDILIDNELYGQYKGELQIALQDMENSGKTNVVGRVVEEEMILLDCLKPWSTFRFCL